MSHSPLKYAKNVKQDIRKRGRHSIYPNMVPSDEVRHAREFRRLQDANHAQYRIYCENIFHSTDWALPTMGLDNFGFGNNVCRTTHEKKKLTNNYYSALARDLVLNGSLSPAEQTERGYTELDRLSDTVLPERTQKRSLLKSGGGPLTPNSKGYFYEDNPVAFDPFY